MEITSSKSLGGNHYKALALIDPETQPLQERGLAAFFGLAAVVSEAVIFALTLTSYT